MVAELREPIVDPGGDDLTGGCLGPAVMSRVQSDGSDGEAANGGNDTVGHPEHFHRPAAAHRDVAAAPSGPPEKITSSLHPGSPTVRIS